MNPRALPGGDVHLGDCLDVLPRLTAGSVALVFLDLPYGVTQNPRDQKIDLARLWPALLHVGRENAAFVFTTQMPFTAEVYASQPNLFRYDLVWDKVLPTGHLNAKKMPLRSHESILVFYQRLPTYNPQFTEGAPSHSYGKAAKERSPGVGGQNYGAAFRTPERTDSHMKYPKSILRFPRSHPSVARHRTEKPDDLLKYLVLTYTDPGDLVVDPTSGSGTTAVACKHLGRRFAVIDNDPDCVETAVRRLIEVETATEKMTSAACATET